MVNATEVFGTITGFKYDKGTMSAPAFMDIDLHSEDEESLKVFAQGKLAKQLFGKLAFGQRVTVTLQDRLILTFESYGE